MDFERFQQFMVESAARHEAEIGMLRESLKESTAEHKARFAVIEDTLGRVSHTMELLVNNQVHVQELRDEDRAELSEFRRSMDDFRKAFIFHVTDPEAHRR